MRTMLALVVALAGCANLFPAEAPPPKLTDRGRDVRDSLRPPPDWWCMGPDEDPPTISCWALVDDSDAIMTARATSIADEKLRMAARWASKAGADTFDTVSVEAIAVELEGRRYFQLTHKLVHPGPVPVAGVAGALGDLGSSAKRADDAISYFTARKRIRESERATIEQREQEVAAEHDADRAAAYRRRMILGAILAGIGEGLSASRSTPAAVAASGCLSDYQCGIGFTCVKENFSGSGSCARVVDSLGTPQYGAMPKPSSIEVKMPSRADCSFDTQCPIGFRCDAKSGACLKR